MSDSKLEELVRQEQREYYRKWRAANPDKVRKANQKYWQRRALRKMEEVKEHDNE